MQPTPNKKYDTNNRGLRPKMSLSLPYYIQSVSICATRADPLTIGCTAQRPSIYPVASQLASRSRLNSEEMWPAAAITSVASALETNSPVLSLNLAVHLPIPEDRIRQTEQEDRNDRAYAC
jgi:hypothetical protein